MPPFHCEVAVVGGGIIGLATARELLLRGCTSVALLEAEPALARHQSGRNSGVVHAGIYYKPASLKARLCLDGLRSSYQYFQQKGIPYRKVGKLIVALDQSEIPRLEQLFQNAITNAVPDVTYLNSPEKIRCIEPECAGIAAIHSPNTGIVDWAVVANHYGDDVRQMGGHILLNSRVVNMQIGHKVSIYTQTPNHPHQSPTDPCVVADRVITCAGVQSDRVAQLAGGRSAPQIVPVRGEYLRVTNAEVAARIRGNIYPVPAAASGAAFLGVHFTPTMAGDIIVGPNAVVALARDGYRGTDVRMRDVADMARYPGFWRLAWRHARFGLREAYRSAFVGAAAGAARLYVPALRAADFERRGAERSGIRAQAVCEQGLLVDDFVFESAGGGRILHTRNAPSPGATSSLPIAKMIVDRASQGAGGK